MLYYNKKTHALLLINKKIIPLQTQKKIFFVAYGMICGDGSPLFYIIYNIE